MSYLCIKNRPTRCNSRRILYEHEHKLFKTDLLTFSGPHKCPRFLDNGRSTWEF